MDILKKDSYRKIVFAVFLVLASGFNAIAEEKQPAQVLMDSYKLSDKLTTEVAKNTILELNHALALCTDDEIKFRIQYRIGILYFKSSDFSQAVDSFKKVAQSADCPGLIRLCSLNMAGQIYRMQAKDDKALGAFEELIEQSQKLLTQDPNQDSSASVLKLFITAGFGRAEIYQYIQNYDSAIAELKKTIPFLGGKGSFAKKYAPLALDRMSQFYLIQGKLEDYNQTAAELIKGYSDYYRVPIVRLETEAVKILKQKEPSVNFPIGSFDTPARLIALIKDSGDKELKDRVTVLLEDLSSQYGQSYGGILIVYHYAWLLDSSGRQKQAAEIFEDICKQAAIINPGIPGTASVVSMLAGYSKLQQSVIFGEENKYIEALKIIHSLTPDPNDIHMLNLSDSIKKALKTLKREVPKDANNK